jgi:hypothetical protein
MQCSNRLRRAVTATTLLAATLAAAAGCARDRDRGEAKPASAPPPVPKQPARVAAGDDDLRVMLAEVAAAKACTLIKGQFRGLRDPKRPGVATGVLWIHGCRITQHGTDVDFQLEGDGWQWAEDRQQKAGATFAVHQYVRFAVQATIPGSLDTAYDQKSHVASIWFTPKQLPEVHFTPVGGVAVDEQGAWSSVVGALGSVFSSSPDEQAEDQAQHQGKDEFRKQFADGLSVTIDLCSGLSRFNLGRPAKGKMVAADVGETHKVPIELHSGGLLVFGPLLAEKGLTVSFRPRAGAFRAELVCHERGEALAKAFAEGAPLPATQPLAAKTVRGETTLRLRSAACPIAVVTRPLGDLPAETPVVFDWQRPSAEAAQATGGPLIRCE